MFCSLLSGVFYICQLGHCWLMVILSSVFLLIISLVVLVSEKGDVSDSNIIVDVCFLSTLVNFCFICFEVLLFCAYTFKIVLSSWWVDSFIIMKCLIIFFALKSFYVL